MGSFINGLAKGFIRSAVNQVGRDAGRVVSNNIYGDAHSIPHRNVSAGGAGRVSSVGKVEDEGIQPIVPSVFQFHKGTIRTCRPFSSEVIS